MKFPELSTGQDIRHIFPGQRSLLMGIIDGGCLAIGGRRFESGNSCNKINPAGKPAGFCFSFTCPDPFYLSANSFSSLAFRLRLAVVPVLRIFERMSTMLSAISLPMISGGIKPMIFLT
jgi:hypothetical protein